MNQKGFIEFLKQKKKSERAIKSYTDYAQQYEAYLVKHKQGKKIETAGKKDLHDFEKWGEENKIKINRSLWGIKEYYDFIQKTGFKGIPPTPGEAQSTVAMAKYIKRLVQY